jgi:hypothetical protein
LPIHHPGLFEFAKPLRKLFLRNRFDRSLKLPESNRATPFVKREKDVNRPLVRDQINGPARRTFDRGMWLRRKRFSRNAMLLHNRFLDGH